MEQQEKPKKKSTFSKVFNPITTLWKKQPNEPKTSLPGNMEGQITYLLNLNPTTQSFEVAASSINSLAQENQDINKLLNNSEFCLELIKQLAQKFKCSDQEIAAVLHSEEAKRRWNIQNQLYELCNSISTETTSSFESLLQQGVDLEFTYKYFSSGFYRTPLMLVSMRKNPILLQKLCTQSDKFDINRRDTEGETALILAVQEGMVASVKILLEAGADPEIPDNNGVMPLKAAQETHNQNIINLIRDAINKKHGKK